MKQFLKTRTRTQWLAAIAWLLLALFIAALDIKQGKVMLAIVEILVYLGLFIGAAWYAYKIQ